MAEDRISELEQEVELLKGRLAKVSPPPKPEVTRRKHSLILATSVNDPYRPAENYMHLNTDCPVFAQMITKGLLAYTDEESKHPDRYTPPWLAPGPIRIGTHTYTKEEKSGLTTIKCDCGLSLRASITGYGAPVICGQKVLPFGNTVRYSYNASIDYDLEAPPPPPPKKEKTHTQRSMEAALSYQLNDC